MAFGGLWLRVENATRAVKDGVDISLHVSPGAKRTEIKGPHGDSSLKLRVCAPPADGKANAEIGRFLSELLGARRSDVEVVRGASLSGVREALAEHA